MKKAELPAAFRASLDATFTYAEKILEIMETDIVMEALVRGHLASKPSDRAIFLFAMGSRWAEVQLQESDPREPR